MSKVVGAVALGIVWIIVLVLKANWYARRKGTESDAEYEARQNMDRRTSIKNRAVATLGILIIALVFAFVGR